MTTPENPIKKRILLLAGGQSGEHEVSLSSARGVLKALSKDEFEVTPLLISKEGRWLSVGESCRAPHWPNGFQYRKFD